MSEQKRRRIIVDFNEHSALNAVAEDLKLLKHYHDEQMFVCRRCGYDDQPEVEALLCRVDKNLANLAAVRTGGAK